MSTKRHQTSYDPAAGPDPNAWLAMPEDQRLRAVATFHMVHELRNGNQKAHAAMHVIVENQIAMGFGPTVRAMQRLQADGLSRHESLHAIASVLAEHLYGAAQAAPKPDSAALQGAINQGIESLSAAAWKANFGNAAGEA